MEATSSSNRVAGPFALAASTTGPLFGVDVPFVGTGLDTSEFGLISEKVLSEGSQRLVEVGKMDPL